MVSLVQPKRNRVGNRARAVALAAAAAVLLPAAGSRAAITTAVDRDATSDNNFTDIPNVPALSATDLGTSATVAIVAGALEGASGPATKANDGLGTNDADFDDPADVIFTNGNDGLRVLYTLPVAADITQVNAYTQHPSNRSQMRINVYGALGTEGGFDATPTFTDAPRDTFAASADPDLTSRGYTYLATLDSTAVTQGGEHGGTIRDLDDGLIGSYQYVLFDVYKVGNGTFYAELDVVPEPAGGAALAVAGAGLLARQRRAGRARDGRG